MKPDGRFINDIRVPPGIPRVVSLRLSCDEAPIDRAHFIFLRHRQYRVKCAACTARHIFGAKYRAIELLQEYHFLLEALWPSIVVKCDDIRVVQLDLLGLGWR